MHTMHSHSRISTVWKNARQTKNGKAREVSPGPRRASEEDQVNPSFEFSSTSAHLVVAMALPALGFPQAIVQVMGHIRRELTMRNNLGASPRLSRIISAIP